MSFEFSQASFDNLQLKLSPSVQGHVFKVYSNMTQMLLISTVGCLIDASQIMRGGLLTLFAAIACLFGFYAQDESLNPKRAKMFLCGFALAKGLSLGPLISAVIDLDPAILVAAIGSTVLIFASFSLAVLYSAERQSIYVGGLLSSCLSLAFWLQVSNFFFQSNSLFSIELYLGLLTFSLFVIYDTQIMIAKAEAGSKLVLRHSLDLYVDIVGLFVRIVMIMLRKNDQKKRDKKR